MIHEFHNARISVSRCIVNIFQLSHPGFFKQVILILNGRGLFFKEGHALFYFYKFKASFGFIAVNGEER